MSTGAEQPHFIVDEGAPPGTREAFDSLIQLVEEHPTEAPAIFAAVGTTIEDVAQRAGELEPGDGSYAARAARALASILVEQFDQEVALPATDEAMHRRIEGYRGRIPLEQRRVQRIGIFVGSIARAAVANTPHTHTSKAA